MIAALELPVLAAPVPPEELFRARALLDALEALLHGWVGNHELGALSRTVSASYPPPTSRRWYWPWPILNGTANCDGGSWTFPASGGEGEEVVENCPDFTHYKSKRKRLRFPDEPVLNVPSWDLAGQEEATRGHSAYLRAFEAEAAAWPACALDWLELRYQQSDDRNLANRLRDLVAGLREATDRATLRAAIRRVDAFAEELADLADKDEVKAWCAGRASDEEGVPYWLDVEQRGQEAAEDGEEQRRWRADYEEREREEGRARRSGLWLPPASGVDPDAATLRIPGFVSGFMDLCLATAPYPNERLSFAAALATLAFLVSRKVCDSSDVRPNLYVTALAPSGAGKDHPRKIAKLIAQAAGMSSAVAESIASAQGLEDALQVQPSFLFMLDEADALLRALEADRDQRQIEISRALLTLYSASSSTYSLRIKAGAPGATIDQPHVTCLWTAITQFFFAALTERLLTNGLASRMFLVDATGPRVGQQGKIPELTQQLAESAAFWRDFEPAGNDLSMAHPKPHVIPSDREAEELLERFRVECDRSWDAAESEAERTIHARTCEKARKLALLYAVSEARPPEARITKAAAEWSVAFARQQAAEFLALTGRYSATNPFEQGCRRVLELLRATQKKRLARSALMKKLKVSSKQANEWILALLEREEIGQEATATRGRAATFYFLP